ncbi:MAG: hypothetical protein HYZ37_09515 [Candidatus Solibacter usitatus]|nr:hypothetical protein [Candidatus Solibacter usitatus]
MCQFVTVVVRFGIWAALILIPAFAQQVNWRKVGNSGLDVSLPSLASGPVARVWYADDGLNLSIQTQNGRVWQTDDFETWKAAGTLAPSKAPGGETPVRPEIGVRTERAGATRWYAVGRFVHRSDDGGSNWNNLTAFRGESILGDGLVDFAVSPRDADEITVASQFGVWRSLDGGITWAGLNQGLPNFPGRRILSTPNGIRPARAGVVLPSGEEFDLEWAPGEKAAWRTSPVNTSDAERRLRMVVSQQIGTAVSAVAVQSDWIYAGTSDGRMFVSSDRGRTWLASNSTADAGAVQAIHVYDADPRIALAGYAWKSGSRGPRLARTSNGGRIWDDASGNLTAGVSGLTAHVSSGTIYAATADGVFQATTDLLNLTPAGVWSKVNGLPAGVLDVKLDDAGNQIYALVEGYGVYAAMAPHRIRAWSIVNAADFSNRPAAPGALLSILGAQLDRAAAGSANAPVLSSSESETQIQVPFEVSGSILQLRLINSSGEKGAQLPLEAVSPAIFLDRDGSALLLDGDSGSVLDSANPARSGSRVQIMAAGLGAVTPAWPAGVPAPSENTPQVAARVRVFLDNEPVDVVHATLAPAYVGFYLVEVQLPKLLNAGPAELYVEVAGKLSNRVRLYLMP